MRVSAQYAQEHFADIAGAADRGEGVEIERAGKPLLRLVVDAAATRLPVGKKRLIGAANGAIWLADDWDSQETNKKIEALFENSDFYPDASRG